MKKIDKKSGQVNKNPTTLIRIDRGLLELVKVKAIDQGTSIKSLVEDALGELLAVDVEGEYGKRKT